jgi:hypothetical protein
LPPAGICIFSRCLSEDHSCPIFLPPGLHFPNRPRNFSLAPCAPSRLTPNLLAFWTLSERSTSSGAPVAKTQHTNAHPPIPDTQHRHLLLRKAGNMHMHILFLTCDFVGAVVVDPG